MSELKGQGSELIGQGSEDKCLGKVQVWVLGLGLGLWLGSVPLTEGLLLLLLILPTLNPSKGGGTSGVLGPHGALHVGATWEMTLIYLKNDV